MILIARQIGFSRAHKVIKHGDTETREKESRWDLLPEDQRQSFFAPSLGFDYLLDALTDIGFVENGGFGDRPWPPSEILSLLKGLIPDFEAWEFRALLQMSRSYMMGKTLGENAYAIPPGYEDDDDEL